MNRKTLLATLAALAIAGSGTFALAQGTAPTAPPTTSDSSQMHRMHGDHGIHDRFDRHGRHGHGMRGHRFGPGGAVIGDLMRLQHLYASQGRTADITALYQHVLASTQNQQVRNFAYDQLARTQMKPADVNAAIGTLRKSLDENLAALNKQQQERQERKDRRQNTKG